MIWLTWRRHRMVIVLALVALAALTIWMYFVAHWWTDYLEEDARLFKLCGRQNATCIHHFFSNPAVRNFSSVGGTFSISRQATAIDLILLAVPCLVGVILGAPLVAGEFTHFTNRLAWTQGVSRTKWLMVSWPAIALPLAAIVALFSRFEWWWSFHAYFGTTFLDRMWDGRVSPPVFPVTGLVPTAYSLFAFSLGAALGAIFRRVSMAAVGTVVAYIAIALLMVTSVRPTLAPRVFVPATNLGYGSGIPVFEMPWNLGPGYRFVPRYTAPAGASATTLGIACLNADPDSEGNQDDQDSVYLSCLDARHVQNGTFYMPYSSFWSLQRNESGIYLALTAAFFGLSIWSVRRWQA